VTVKGLKAGIILFPVLIILLFILCAGLNFAMTEQPSLDSAVWAHAQEDMRSFVDIPPLGYLVFGLCVSVITTFEVSRMDKIEKIMKKNEEKTGE
jgi:hypothetical protein